MEAFDSPRASALLTNTRSLRLMACTRMSLALPGQLVRPMIIITLVMLLPKSATVISTRKKVGSMRKMLMSSLITLSVCPPINPAAPPMSMPSTPEISAAMKPTFSEVRVPSTIMEYTSPPRASVPSQYSPPGAALDGPSRR